jgi:hypothetical protein
MIRIILLITLLCFGCQTGRIPCPKVKGAKLIKSGKRYRAYHASLSAKAESKEVEQDRPGRASEERYIRNVSVEEWDCPEPGSKKYLPRNVKENIKRNTRKIQEDMKKQAADSLSGRRR